jgi:hypothetical protein
MSVCGNSGKSQQNAQRDVVAATKRMQGLEVKPQTIRIPKYCKATGKLRNSTIKAICPHDVLSVFDEREDKSLASFGLPANWVLFWQCARHEPWMVAHPLRKCILGNPHLCIPYVIHVDDAPVSRRVGRNIRAMSLVCPMATDRDTFSGRIALAVMQNDEPLQAMIENRAEGVIQRSLTAAAFNECPKVGPFNLPLHPARAATAGQPVTRSGRRLVFAGIASDWAYTAQDFNIPWNYEVLNICKNAARPNCQGQ